MGSVQSVALLPGELRAVLSTIGTKFEKRQCIKGEAGHALRLLNELPAAAAVKAEREIAIAARLYHYWRRPKLWAAQLATYPSDADQLESVPGLEYLFIFHMDGTIREAALNKIAGGAPSPFLFAAIAWRLNDWAPPVREAAAECAKRIFPLTSADVIAQAGMVLLCRESSWGRWTNERAVLVETFSQPNVAAALACAIKNKRTGSAATILQRALQNSGLDPFLETLAREARQPAVRAIALLALINGYASWPNGFAWQWIDKSMGIRKRVQVLSQRPFKPGISRRAAIAMGVADRSATVKKSALDALTHYRAEIPDARKIAEPLLTHRSVSIRQRAEFLLTITEKLS